MTIPNSQISVHESDLHGEPIVGDVIPPETQMIIRQIADQFRARRQTIRNLGANMLSGFVAIGPSEEVQFA